MAGLLEELRLANTWTFAEYDFLNPNCRVSEFGATATRRGSARPKMQNQGNNPRSLLYGSLDIHQTGRLITLSPEELIAERDSFLAAVVGDLSGLLVISNEPLIVTGTLTVRYAGWAESASQSVSVEHWECPLKAEDGIKTAAYMIDFEATDPFFLGDDSGDPYTI
jgi:hypothetical protein